jgi:dienelactone hydrolase
MRIGPIFVVGLGVVALCTATLGFRSAERRLLFPVPPTPGESPVLGSDVEHTWLDIPDGRVEGFLLRSRSLGQGGSPPLIIYAHGNGELVDYWLRPFGELQSQGMSVLLVEYPGYGRSMGVPSENSIQHALAAGYDWAVSQPGIDSARVVGYGRSLGGGAVCALASVRTLAALVLESTFTSVRDVAAEVFHVPRLLIRRSFDNLTVLAGYRAPVLILHGESDRSIPVSQARRLAATAHDSTLQILQCGHNDCPPPLATLKTFLIAHGLLSS